MRIRAFQKLIHDTFHHLDTARGIQGNFLWFIEEVGELAEAIRHRRTTKKSLEGEFADVMAWLMSLASLKGIDMEEALRKYAKGCPRCERVPCRCAHPEQKKAVGRRR